jgi:hypothetical protein
MSNTKMGQVKHNLMLIMFALCPSRTCKTGPRTTDLMSAMFALGPPRACKTGLSPRALSHTINQSVKSGRSHHPFPGKKRNRHCTNITVAMFSETPWTETRDHARAKKIHQSRPRNRVSLILEKCFSESCSTNQGKYIPTENKSNPPNNRYYLLTSLVNCPTWPVQSSSKGWTLNKREGCFPLTGFWVSPGVYTQSHPSRARQKLVSRTLHTGCAMRRKRRLTATSCKTPESAVKSKNPMPPRWFSWNFFSRKKTKYQKQGGDHLEL